MKSKTETYHMMHQKQLHYGNPVKNKNIKYYKEINLYCKSVSSNAIFSYVLCFVLETNNFINLINSCSLLRNELLTI